MDTQLAQTAAARKERLIALRRRKEAHDKGDSANGSTHFTFKQRNFDPETRQARKREVGESGEDTVEKAVEGLAEEIVAEDEERRAEDLDLFNIQPRRPNWDLKRDMTARMGKLERRTNESIAIILRQRLREQRGSNDQVDLVAGISAAQAEGDRAVAEDNEDDE